MARYRGPRLRIIRRLGELPGLTQKTCTRNFPPGQHGPKNKVTGNNIRNSFLYAIPLHSYFLEYSILLEKFFCILMNGPD